MVTPINSSLSSAKPLSEIGRLLKSSTREFVFACRVAEPDVPLFGSYARAPSQQNQSDVIGLIYNITVEDDPFVKQMVAASDSLPEARFENYVLDNRLRRKVPIEVSVLVLGYRNSEGFAHSLPPQPPITLDKIYYCAGDEIQSFTERLDFLQLILDAPEVPADQLIVAALLKAASVRPDRDRFLKTAGRELARLLSRDLARLENLLRRIKP